MTDPTFVGAAYAIALGGLVLYVGSIARRLRRARRTAEVFERERQRVTPDSVPPTSGPEVGADLPGPEVGHSAAGSDVLRATWDGR